MSHTRECAPAEKAKKSTADSAESILSTDGELLMRFVRHRDDGAFAEIVARHGGLVWIVCREVLRHHQDIEDAFQATFFILAERAGSIRSSESAAAWLYKVAQRTSLAARRKRSRRREEELAVEPLVGDDELFLLPERETLYVLLQELGGLPEQYRAPLVLRYLEGQSRRTIAAQTDSTVPQIQGRLVRGRRLLRSRMLRRGVSLSVATGALAGATATAKAAVTPIVAATTAKSCLALTTTGVAAGATAAAIQLAKQGAKAMWLASMMKTTAAVSTALVAAGVAWAVQGGGGNGEIGKPTINVVALQSGPESRGGAMQGGPGDAAKLIAGRLKHKIPVEIGATEFREGGRIEIEEVWGTRPRIEVGGQYMVRGRYVLPKGERGKLYFYETATGKWGREATANVDLQTVELDKESGEFTLVHGMAGPGHFHLYLASPDKYSRMFGNVYFGSGDNVRRKGLGTTEVEVKATALVVDQTQPQALPPVQAAVSVEEAEKNADQELRKKRLDAQVTELRERIAKNQEEKLEYIQRLAKQKTEEALLQRELGRTHESLVMLRLDSNEGESEDAKKKHAAQVYNLQKSVEELKERLANALRDSALTSAQIEQVDLELSELSKMKSEVSRMKLQMEFAAPAAATTPASVFQNRLGVVVDATGVPPTEQKDDERLGLIGQSAPKLANAVGLARTTDTPTPTEMNVQAQISASQSDASIVQPMKTVRIRVAGAFANAPIDGVFVVEPMGTVALGPEYGRVKVAGLPILEAEAAIKKELSKIVANPEVQLTIAAPSLNWEAAVPAPVATTHRDKATFVAGPNTLTFSNRSNDVASPELAKQLDLEQQSWAMKAKAYRLKAEGIKRAMMENKGAMSESEGASEALLLQADANHAEAMALEIGQRLKALAKTQPNPEVGADAYKALQNDNEKLKKQLDDIKAKIDDANKAK